MKVQAYDSYKNTDFEWIGEIPKSWSLKRVGHHVDFITGFAFKSDLFSFEDGIRLVRGDNVTEGILRWGEKTRCWPKLTKSIEQYLLQDQDILIGMDGSKVGKNYAVVRESDLPLLLVQRVARLRTDDELDFRYLTYLIGSELFRIWVTLVKTDPAIPHISPKDIRSFPLPYPPFHEQRAIGKFLDHEVSKIDTLIEKQQQLIKLLKEKRQAVISHAVTKGLNPDAPMRDSGVEWLGEVPEHWSVARIKYHTTLFEQGWSPQCDSRPADAGEYGVLKVGCVNGGVFNSIENKVLPAELEPQLQYTIKQNDLLISRANTKELVGSAAVVDQDCDNLILCDKLYRLRFNSTLSDYPRPAI